MIITILSEHNLLTLHLSGSAGCVLANRLSEEPSNKVLLLESGPKDTLLDSFRLLWKIHMPAALTYNLCDDKYNWYGIVVCFCKK